VEENQRGGGGVRQPPKRQAVSGSARGEGKIGGSGSGARCERGG
jgi:hypothetical protein